YYQVSTFGWDTIQRFMTNLSEMKRTTAHNFDDLLQCALPVLYGLLTEPHNTSILKLIFCIAHWHVLAKLCMHTDNTLKILEKVAVSLGKQL
ncbi:hypothetical protein SERLA73DRAFT_52311, partial [Serpula lacrymans var. lacrymans S7.3]